MHQLMISCIYLVLMNIMKPHMTEKIYSINQETDDVLGQDFEDVVSSLTQKPNVFMHL